MTAQRAAENGDHVIGSPSSLASQAWGKSRLLDNGKRELHPLADHATDVAIVFRCLLEQPRMFASLQSCTETELVEVLPWRLAVIAFLHDLGKCNRGFQALIDPSTRETAGHRLEGVALLLDQGLRPRWPSVWIELLQDMVGWFAGDEADQEEALIQLLIAALSHHGRPIAINDLESASPSPARWWAVRGDVDPMRHLADLALAARQRFASAFKASGPLLLATPAFQQRFAGLVMLADWIASDIQFFPYRKDDEEDRVTLAQAAAQRALKSIGLKPASRRKPSPFEAIFGFAPSPLQDAFDRHLPLGPSSQLCLAESDTGSGKTEAALAWFLRLYSKARVDGLYFALPTRVAARELYGRVCKALNLAFDEGDRPGPILLAAPGYARVDGAEPTLTDPRHTLWDDSDPLGCAERQWVAAHPKRFLAAPVAVGTLDQALLATLQTKHSLMRSVCLDRHLLVVDEVHASDPYMSTLLRALLTGHLARGGHALLLSATLGEVARSTYFDRQCLPLAQAEALPYPAFSDTSGMRAIAGNGRSKCVRIEFLPSLDESSLLSLLLRAMQQGARVLVVCNTVARANALLRAVEACDLFDPRWLFQVRGQVCPHHGRFARVHRELMDAAVSARLGKDSAAGPLLLIGTQTLEQSLDIDADWLVSDACPMDVLLQRIGRLHRHQRAHRPEDHQTPRVLLRVPEGADLTRYLNERGDRFSGPVGIGRVYADARVVQRTLDLLRAAPDLVLPRDNRRLVEQATHPEALSELADPRWQRYGWEVIGKELGEQRLALNAVLTSEPFGELQYRDSDGDLRIRTRLGSEALSLRLIGAPAQPLGLAINDVAIPAHLLPNGGGPWPEEVMVSPCLDGLHFELGAQGYRYTRFGLEKEDSFHA